MRTGRSGYGSAAATDMAASTSAPVAKHRRVLRIISIVARGSPYSGARTCARCCEDHAAINNDRKALGLGREHQLFCPALISLNLASARSNLSLKSHIASSISRKVADVFALSARPYVNTLLLRRY